jgi:hypothetical protein
MYVFAWSWSPTDHIEAQREILSLLAPRSTARRLATQDPSLRGTIHHIVAEDGSTMQTDISLARYSWADSSLVAAIVTQARVLEAPPVPVAAGP